MKKLLVILTLLACNIAIARDVSGENLDADKMAAKIAADRKGNAGPIASTSQKNGYRIDFNEGGGYLHMWGLGRLYWYPYSNNSKITQPYFRMYFDGKKTDELMFRVRMDYQHFYFDDTEKVFSADGTAQNENGTKTIYFGRAYVTYAPKALPNWSFDIGRILNQQHKYDVLGGSAFDGSAKALIGKLDQSYTGAEYDVAEGIDSSYKNGNFTAKFAFTYRGNSAKDGAPQTERFYYSGRVGHSLDFGKRGTLGYGVAGSISSHRQTETEFYEILPDLLWSINGWYALLQGQYRDVYDSQGKFSTSDYKFLYKNYFEVGTDFEILGVGTAVDSFIDSAYYGGQQAHNLGLEAFMYLPHGLMLGGSFSYANFTNQYLDGKEEHSNFFRRISGSVLINKYF